MFSLFYKEPQYIRANRICKVFGKHPNRTLVNSTRGGGFSTKACISLPYGPSFSVKMFSFLKKNCLFSLNVTADLFYKLELPFAMNTGQWNISLFYYRCIK